MKIKIRCPHCAQEYPVSLKNTLQGQNVWIECHNNKCKQKIPVLVPVLKDVSNDQTVIMKSGDKRPQSLELFVESEPGIEQHISLISGDYILGRESIKKDVDIEILNDDESLSRQHCKLNVFIESDNITCTISDYKSKNGVYINGRKLEKNEEFYLINDDKILLGRTVIIFKEKFQ
ncbi:MAG: FHA domain-containing protein [Saprospiraceae bacterium]